MNRRWPALNVSCWRGFWCFILSAWDWQANRGLGPLRWHLVVGSLLNMQWQPTGAQDKQERKCDQPRCPAKLGSAVTWKQRDGSGRVIGNVASRVSLAAAAILHWPRALGSTLGLCAWCWAQKATSCSSCGTNAVPCEETGVIGDTSQFHSK